MVKTLADALLDGADMGLQIDEGKKKSKVQRAKNGRGGNPCLENEKTLGLGGHPLT